MPQKFYNFLRGFGLKLINSKEKSPTLSHNVFKKKIVPYLKKNDSTLLVLIDNLRLDQWKIIEPLISKYFNIENEDMYCSILPTTTHYSRNSFFAGLTPNEIKTKFILYFHNDPLSRSVKY